MGLTCVLFTNVQLLETPAQLGCTNIVRPTSSVHEIGGVDNTLHHFYVNYV